MEAGEIPGQWTDASVVKGGPGLGQSNASCDLLGAMPVKLVGEVR